MTAPRQNAQGQNARRESVRVGAGAGYAGDRWEPALELVEKGGIDYLVFECLAERTIAREALTRLHNPELGYNPGLVERMRAVLPECLRRGVRIVTNMGAANPLAAARRIRREAADLGINDVPCAVVLGDDVADTVRKHPELTLLETGDPLETILGRMEAANAYLGADAVAAALATGAPVVVTGRVADPSLFVGPMLYELGWDYDDYAALACGTVAGHLLECAGQVTGGYFADPGKKEVPDPHRLGFPFAEVTRGGAVVLGKPDGSGGRIDRMTCTEQLLYEMHDPAAYITPDCVLDVTGVDFVADGKDRVRVTGARARQRTASYKVSVGYRDGYIGEGQMSYGGPNAAARARLAGEIVTERLKLRGFAYAELRVDYIGMSSLHGAAERRHEPYEVRLRVAARTPDKRAAEAVGGEVETLYTNGPAGGAGDFKAVREILAVQSVLLPRALVTPSVAMEAAS
jgi:hypothetical protein